MIVEYSGYEIVRARYSMQISRKMKVDIFHRSYLSHTAAGRSALDAEYGSQRRFSECKAYLFAEFRHAVRQAYRSGRLALSERGRIYCGNKYEFAFFVVPLIDFGFILAVLLIVVVRKPELCGYFGYRLQCHAVCDFDIRLHLHSPLKAYIIILLF